jgi:hypothetical protein
MGCYEMSSINRLTELIEHGVGGVNTILSASYTRPNDTNAYAANDVIADSTASPTNLSISTGMAKGSSIMITSARIRVDGHSSLPAGIGNFRVALFSSAPTAINDNAAFDVISADKAKFLDYIDIGTPIDLGSRIFGKTNGINSHIKLASTSNTLYAQLITLGGYTPVAQDVYTIFLGCMEMRN